MLTAATALCAAFTLPTPAPISARAVSRNVATPAMLDMETIGGVAIALAGVGGGIGLIVLTENAGKRNEESDNQQPCVECKGAKVVECTICKGTGRDQFAELVAGVQEMTGEEGSIATATKVVVDDWEEGEKTVEMYAEILAAYPPKVTGPGACVACDARGVVVCDNCQGSGIQPRFLERYSPDDFMD